MSKNRRNSLRLVSSQSEPLPAIGGGRIVHDTRGNAVWDWEMETGIFKKKTMAELAEALANGADIALEADGAEWAGDPYNRTPRKAG